MHSSQPPLTDTETPEKRLWPRLGSSVAESRWAAVSSTQQHLPVRDRMCASEALGWMEWLQTKPLQVHSLSGALLCCHTGADKHVFIFYYITTTTKKFIKQPITTQMKIYQIQSSKIAFFLSLSLSSGRHPCSQIWPNIANGAEGRLILGSSDFA